MSVVQWTWSKDDPNTYPNPLTEAPNPDATKPTGMCGSTSKCGHCPSDFICTMKARSELEFIKRKNDGWCPSREDETHCVHWWDGEEACCSCSWGCQG